MDDINGRKEIIFSNDILIFSSLQRYASKWGINYFCKASSSLMINVIVYMCILLHLFQTRISLIIYPFEFNDICITKKCRCKL